MWEVERDILKLLKKDENKTFGLYGQKIAEELEKDKGYVHDAIKRLLNRNQIQLVKRAGAPKNYKFYKITEDGRKSLVKSKDWMGS